MDRIETWSRTAVLPHPEEPVTVVLGRMSSGCLPREVFRGMSNLEETPRKNQDTLKRLSDGLERPWNPLRSAGEDSCGKAGMSEPPVVDTL